MQNILTKILQSLLIAFFILIPFQIKTSLFHPLFFASGNFEPYETFFLYINDFILIGAGIVWGITLITEHKNKVQAKTAENQKITFGPRYSIISALLIIILLESQIILNEDYSLKGFTMLIRLIEWIGLYLMLINGVIRMKNVLKIFTIIMTVQAIIALLQFGMQSSIQLQVLGEPLLSPNIDGVAKIDIGSEKLMRSYGTLPHANILAGLITLSLYSTMLVWGKKYGSIMLSLQILGLLVSFSRSAILSILFGLVLYLVILKPKRELKKKSVQIGAMILISVILLSIMNIETLAALKKRTVLDLSEKAITERIQYMETSWKIIKQFPFMGTGLKDGTWYMQQFQNEKLSPWEKQPVHNIILLITTELGIVGLLIFLIVVSFSFRKLCMERKKFIQRERKEVINVLFLCFVSILFMMQFDHFFLTSYQGQILLVMFLAFLNKEGLFYNIVPIKEGKPFRKS